MSVRMRERQVGEITIYDCEGRMTLGEGACMVRDTLREAMRAGKLKIILNMEEVHYTDASGIGEMVSASTTLSLRGGRLKLLNLSKRVKDLLQITKLYSAFDVHDDEGGAIRSFN